VTSCGKRCVLHYSVPNGMVYPFCIYDSGACFREKIEEEFLVPFDLNAEKKNGNRLLVVENS